MSWIAGLAGVLVGVLLIVAFVVFAPPAGPGPADPVITVEWS